MVDGAALTSEQLKMLQNCIVFYVTKINEFINNLKQLLITFNSEAKNG